MQQSHRRVGPRASSCPEPFSHIHKLTLASLKQALNPESSDFRLGRCPPPTAHTVVLLPVLSSGPTHLDCTRLSSRQHLVLWPLGIRRYVYKVVNRRRLNTEIFSSMLKRHTLTRTLPPTRHTSAVTPVHHIEVRSALSVACALCATAHNPPQRRASQSTETHLHPPQKERRMPTTRSRLPCTNRCAWNAVPSCRGQAPSA